MLLFAIYLASVIALPIALSAAIGWRSLPRNAACPCCGQDTLPLLSHAIRTVQKLYPDFSMQRRFCPACEWTGFTRVYVARAFVRHEPAIRSRQEVRTLELGGRPWHVLLESWRERDRHYGRLLFMGPSGRMWTDPTASFDGVNYHDVLAQARAISDGLLTYRLREVISN